MVSSNAQCIVLLSGGLDSTTVLAIANQTFTIHALSFDYGQRHKFELESAKKIATHFHVQNHKIITIDLAQFGQSALTDDIEVPKNANIGEGIPITYVPVRNTIFLSYALAYAEVNKIYDIFIGVFSKDENKFIDVRIGQTFHVKNKEGQIVEGLTQTTLALTSSYNAELKKEVYNILINIIICFIHITFHSINCL